METRAPRICFDRHLPRDLLRPQTTLRSGRMVRAISPIGKTWMNGSTLRVRFLGGTPVQHATVREQAGWWAAAANLRFQFDNAPDAEIRIDFDANDGAWSYIGTDCRSIPRDEPTMNLGFLDGGTAAHEFGHAIGLAHEHQSPHGGIQWNEQVVINAMAGPPNYWDPQTTRHNILRRYAAGQINGTAFDPKSIMLYFFPPEWTVGGTGTSANDVLSELDKAFVAGARMYPKTAPTVTDAVELHLDARRRTAAAIGQIGEEDLFHFVVPREGRYLVDTRGPTDVVMKLFGPDSQTALLAEDDDSGLATNARIASRLLPGDYYVQVRHYNRQRGVGNYSIRAHHA